MIVTLKKALEMLETTENGIPVPHEIEYYSYSRSRKTGGEIIKLSKVTMNRLGSSTEKPSPTVQSKQAVREGRQPAHFKNSTRNVTLPNGEPRKFHIRLLRKINGLTIVY